MKEHSDTGNIILNLQCWPQCSVWTFNSSHAASLDALHCCECIYDYYKFKTLLLEFKS